MAKYDFKLRALGANPAPLKEASEILQFLGEKLIRNLLASQPPPGLRPPNLNTLLSPQEARILTSLSFWQLKKKSGEPSKKKAATDEKITLTDLITRAFKEKVKPHRWQSEFQHQLVHALEDESTPKDFPFILMPLIEKTAWQNLRFTHFLVETLTRYLWERVLLNPGERFIPVLAPETFRALVGLTGIDKQKTQRQYIENLETIRDTSRRRVLNEGWAGFWDQWLLRIAVSRWAKAFTEKNSRFIRSIIDLPLVTKKNLAEEEPKPGDKEKQKKRKDREPEQFKNKKHPVPLAHPDWRGQIPSPALEFI